MYVVGIPIDTVKRIINNMLSEYVAATNDGCKVDAQMQTDSFKHDEDANFIEPSVDDSWKMLVGIAEATNESNADEEIFNIIEGNQHSIPMLLFDCIYIFTYHFTHVVPALISMTMSYHTISCMTQYNHKDLQECSGTSTLRRIMSILGNN